MTPQTKTLQNKTPPDRSQMLRVNRNHCPQCGAWLLAPNWSEYLSERCVRHTWGCDACRYEFETSVYFAPQAQAA